MNKKGFSLIELLIVIAIIGLIAGISIVSLSEPRNKAWAVKTVNDAKNIGTGLYLMLKKDARSDWWPETYFGLGENPAIENINALSEFLPMTPKPPFSGASPYRYDNDGDVLAEEATGDAGVNIMLFFQNDLDRDTYFEYIDNAAEPGTGPAKGRIRKASSSAIIFNIAPDPKKLGF